MRITLQSGSRARTFLILRQQISSGLVITDIQLAASVSSLLFTYGGAEATPISDVQLWDVISECWKNNGE